MKIRFDKEQLIAAVTPSMSAVSDVKGTTEAIEGILFETDGADSCILSTYDLSKGFRTEIPCQVMEEGSFIINAQKLLRIIKMMPASTILIEIAPEKLMAKITSGRSEFCLSALGGDKFPNLPQLHGEKGFTLEQKQLRRAILQIQHAISVSEQRPVLCGGYFKMSEDGLTVISCDGNRMAYVEKKLSIQSKGLQSENSQIGFIVPGKALSELLKMLDDSEEPVTLEFGMKHIIFGFGKIIFFSRLIEGEYIDYQRLMPKNNSIRVELEREGFIECLERVSLVSDDHSLGKTQSYVKCSFIDDLLQVTSVSSASSVYDELPIRKDGEDIVIGFNCRFLLDALRAIGDERVALTMSTPLMSMTIEPTIERSLEEAKNGQFLYMISPVRMKE